MKKKLEAELISIAHRILKLKNKSELIQLHQETQKLYEKLSVLRFVEENFSEAKPTIGRAAIEEKIEAAFEAVAEPEEVKTETPSKPEATQTQEIIAETNASKPEVIEEAPIAEVSEIAAEENEEIPAEVADSVAEDKVTVLEPEVQPKQEDSTFKPAFELAFDSKEEIKEDAKDEFKSANTQITFEDILGSSYVDPVFVKPEDLEMERETAKSDNVIPIGRNFSDSPVISMNKNEDRTVTLNDRLSKGITIGLNDRVAFMKHLFANSSEDYNRVLSQLITFDTFDEAKSFIENMVRPDYNNWEGKDEYSNRFMEIVEKKFS